MMESPDPIARLRAEIQQRYGLRWEGVGWDVARARLEEQALSKGWPDLVSYVVALCDASGWSEAVDVLTAKETYFFRELPQLQHFANSVLPEIATRQRSIRICSIGCATGEEVYSLAMIVAASERFDERDVSVLGIDVSSIAIERARGASYSDASLRAFPQRHEHYITSDGECRRVAPEIRGLCDFRQANILDGSDARTAECFDVIFFRNTLLYFDVEGRQRALHEARRRLHPQGYLFLGHSEIVDSPASGLVRVAYRGGVVYRRSERYDEGQARCLTRPVW